MASPDIAASTEVPPDARRIVNALADGAQTPVKVLVSGGVGTGKTTVLAAVRDALRGAGVTVLTRPPRDGDRPDAAVVIDDAQLLTDTELLALAERIADPAATVVVAAEPREQHTALRTVAAALEREWPRLSLGPLPVADHFVDSTAGLPFLVRAVTETAQDPLQAAKFALIDRLRRLDESTLDSLLIASLSPGLGAADVAAALDISTTEGLLLVDRARASGLIEPSHSPGFIRLVHDAVAQLVGTAHHHQVEIALLRSQLAMSTLSPDLALRLAEHGLRDADLASSLRRAATEARESGRAARLYRAAVGAGAEGLSRRLADALALTGDCAGAAALADDLLSSADVAERAAAVRVAASVAAHDGHAGQAAELFGWLGPYPDPVVSAAGAITLAATGDLTAARAALRVPGQGPPTAAARAARGLAEGLLMSMNEPYPAAVAKLGQAIAVGGSIGEVIPDSPAALVTLAALHGGDPVRARSIIGRAVRTDGDGFFERRHLLLLGWTKMCDGQLASAGADADAACSGAATDLHRRDALWAATLRTAIARRSGDTGALHKHWYAAMEVLAEYSIDLFTLLPLGELWVAAARMRQVARLRHTLDLAFGLLDSLGNPVLWSVPLHWAGVHAGILTGSPESVAPHGRALTAAASESVFAQALAGAGRTWLRVLADQVDADEVTMAARSLAQFGLTWDATRLAGQAALQTPDARVSGDMLQLARDLKLVAAVEETPDDEPGSGAPKTTRRPPSASPLSAREREVAELLLLGLPYRDIGRQLFISAKTVEHHVARIRRRLGAGSRSEMLSMLRAILAS
ncbi:transcriptional regulator [Mycobacterium europaeum]|uniref:Transcriptional regulator n=1 Tax=Mycobacterium europaeum TaxID=761804 RepID=A0A0U1D6V4_9MYCO|nr:isoniazid response ATPase/transcriptional regulator IniR [Mycobacterium europaeum]ORV50932.1 helix-turn-helix transcriptional regulator [Mycobacterium europaeum]CQD09334.1 transcriptional regulator [Mycobacterium europaeum]